MRFKINKTYFEGKWKSIKVFAIIPVKCYNPENNTTFIVWLEYINMIYKYDFYSNKHIYEGNRTINKKS